MLTFCLLLVFLSQLSSNVENSKIGDRKKFDIKFYNLQPTYV